MRVPIEDRELVPFLQWALPRMGYRWAGFRKVRGQVKKRIGEILAHHDLPDLDAYRAELEQAEPGDPIWETLDSACYITISRFNRDRGVFDALFEDVMPGLAERADAERRALRVWSAGCASGEEPYTIAIRWRWERALAVAGEVPDVELEVIGTDIESHMIARARWAVYPRSTLRELPDRLVEQAFEPVEDSDSDGDEGEESEDEKDEDDKDDKDQWRLRTEWRRGVTFQVQDLRETTPAGPFDVIACRNTAYMYFDAAERRRTTRRLVNVLRPGGVLLVGNHDCEPEHPALKRIETKGGGNAPLFRYEITSPDDEMASGGD